MSSHRVAARGWQRTWLVNPGSSRGFPGHVQRSDAISKSSTWLVSPVPLGNHQQVQPGCLSLLGALGGKAQPARVWPASLLALPLSFGKRSRLPRVLSLSVLWNKSNPARGLFFPTRTPPQAAGASWHLTAPQSGRFPGKFWHGQEDSH